jgi:hypothetical protein
MCAFVKATRMFGRRFLVILCLCGSLVPDLNAGTYALLDGTSVNGDPISYNENGVVIGSATSPRISWEKFTQESLKKLAAEARSPRDAAFISPFLEEVVQAEAKRKQIEVKQPDRVELPAKGTGIFAMFGSPVGLAIIGVLLLASLYAGYEIAAFREHPASIVCAASIILPFIGPLAFLFIRRGTFRSTPLDEPQPAVGEAPAVAAPSAAPPPQAAYAPPPPPRSSRPHTVKLKSQQEEAPAPAPASALPEPVAFEKGEFTFNRRFFETKTPGFFRMIPAESEKDLVLVITAVRGHFVGRRIMKITATELFLQTFKGDVTADEMIPFGEIQRVEIRHRDTL